MDEMLSKNSIRYDNWRPEAEELPAPKRGAHVKMDSRFFWRKYAIVIIGAALFTVWSVLLASWVNYRADKRADELSVQRRRG